jgi:hypothetical protein
MRVEFPLKSLAESDPAQAVRLAFVPLTPKKPAESDGFSRFAPAAAKHEPDWVCVDPQLVFLVSAPCNRTPRVPHGARCVQERTGASTIPNVGQPPRGPR